MQSIEASMEDLQRLICSRTMRRIWYEKEKEGLMI